MQQQQSLPPIVLSTADRARLERVARQAVADRHPVGPFLLGEVRRAETCEAPPADTVALGRRVTYRVDNGWASQSRVLVCPDDYVDPESELSVLSPVGAALIGLRTGAQMPYRSIEGFVQVAAAEALEPPAPRTATVLFPDWGRRARPTAFFHFDDRDDPDPAA